MKNVFLLLLMLAVSHTAYAEVTYSADGLRDPFFESTSATQPVTISDGETGIWVLNGILWSPTMSQAQINGQKVRVGDHLSDVEVVEIDRKGVKLKRYGKEGYLTKQGIQWT